MEQKHESTISLIVAISKNRVIGRDNKIPWHISADLKRFRALTIGHPIIMGRKTFESIGKPLPKRTNIIVTRDVDYAAEGVEVTHSIDEAIKQAQGKEGSEEVFIIGGGQIYNQSMNLADRLYLTVVDEEVEGDVFFPDYSEFKKIVSKEDNQSGDLKYSFLTLEK